MFSSTTETGGETRLAPYCQKRFRAETAALPRTTEAERLVIQRIRQNVFRDALMDYWGGRCSLTGITDRSCAPPISCPGPTAPTRSASMCTTASCFPHFGTPPSTVGCDDACAPS